MPRLPRKEKSRILKSSSFKRWKTARVKPGVHPRAKAKDLLRAFQIDKSLKAKERSEKYWSKHPNRADITIDKGKETWSREKKKYYRKRRR